MVQFQLSDSGIPRLETNTTTSHVYLPSKNSFQTNYHIKLGSLIIRSYIIYIHVLVNVLKKGKKINPWQ